MPPPPHFQVTAEAAAEELEDWEEEDGDWEEEDEDWEDGESDAEAGAAATLGSARLTAAGADEPSFALAFLATLPLLALYEWARASGRVSGRNVFELLLSLPLQPLGGAQHGVRVVGLVCAGVAAVLVVRAERLAVWPGLGRTWAEGALAAICLGPCLVGVQQVLGAELIPLPDLGGGGPGASPSLERAMFHLGGAGFEELVARVGLLSLIYVVVRHAASFLGAPLGVARMAADVLAIMGSALLFAGLHLDAMVGWLGSRGAEFDGPTFFWRFLAGVLLGTLVRWRGLGVTAWAHGLYNLSAVLGAGPAVFVL